MEKTEMRKRRWLWVILVLLILGSSASFWECSIVHWIEPHPGKTRETDTSTNLSRDLKLMWETQPLPGTHDSTHGSNPRSSTDRAINAASRVFNTVDLVGKTRDEVLALLGSPKSSGKSIYNFPFWPADKESLVYRFDSGAYGWQFNVVFGEEGRVHEVERLWIH